MENLLGFEDLAIIYPQHLWISCCSRDLEKAQKQIAKTYYTNAVNSHRAFINYLCLNAVVQWLEEEPDLQHKFVVPDIKNDFNQRWEFVNGFELEFQQIRLVLIPSEQGMIDEFPIPQEWLDIPPWAGNYYLPIQVNLEANWLRIWGFISYDKVRKKARYEPWERSYYVSDRDLISDVNMMWVIPEIFRLSAPEVKALPSVSPTQIQAAIAQLSKPSVYSPRLHLDFSLWGAILAFQEYREDLYQKRCGTRQEAAMVNAPTHVENLSLWFENMFVRGWQSVDDLLSLQDSRNLQFRGDSGLNEVWVRGAKLLDLGMQLNNISVVLLIALLPHVDRKKVAIRVQLYPASGETYLPAKMKLALLSESGAILQSIESRRYDNYIQLKRFKLPFKKVFAIQIALEGMKIRENFVLEGFTYSQI